MKLSKWVAEQGSPRVVSKRLGVTEHAVRVWTRRDGTPKATTMRRIIRLSRGRISYADMIVTRKGVRPC